MRSASLHSDSNCGRGRASRSPVNSAAVIRSVRKCRNACRSSHQATTTRTRSKKAMAIGQMTRMVSLSSSLIYAIRSLRSSRIASRTIPASIRSRAAVRGTAKSPLVVGSKYDPELPSARPRVVTAEGVVRVIEILHETRAHAAEEREIAHHMVLDQWAADGAFGAELVVVAGGEAHRRLEGVGRLPREDVDGAADCVAPVERPLGTPGTSTRSTFRKSMNIIEGRAR